MRSVQALRRVQSKLLCCAVPDMVRRGPSALPGLVWLCGRASSARRWTAEARSTTVTTRDLLNLVALFCKQLEDAAMAGLLEAGRTSYRLRTVHVFFHLVSLFVCVGW